MHDAHRDAPTGFRLRVNRRVKTYIVVQRRGGKVVTTTVGRHPDLLVGKDAAPDRNARLLAAARTVRPTLRTLFERWMSDYRVSAKRDPRPNTIAAVEKAQQRLCAKLLDTPADELTWRHLQTFFNDKATKKGHLTAAEQTIRWVLAVYNQENHRLTLDALQDKRQPDLYANPARSSSRPASCETTPSWGSTTTRRVCPSR